MTATGPPFVFSIERCLLTALLAIYAFLAYEVAITKAPWVDEGLFGAAGGNWALNGSTGTATLLPDGSWLNADLTGINRITYWILPVHLVAQALWYKLFGFSLVSLRLLGVACGFLALVSWFEIVSVLANSAAAGCITVGLLACDRSFLWMAADGRMDMMCLAFGSAGLASFLMLRGRDTRLALAVSNSLVALAMFTHPNGLMFPLLLGYLVFRSDRQLLGWRLAPFLIPYLSLAALWGGYLLRAPQYFLPQFGSSAAAVGGARFNTALQPWFAIPKEAGRYFSHYGLHPTWGYPPPNYLMLVPFLFWIGLLSAWMTPGFRKDRGLLTLLCLNLGTSLYMTFFEGMKNPYYLPMIIPSYVAVLATWVWKMAQARRPFAPAALVIAGALVLCNAASVIHSLRADTYKNDYSPAVEFIRKQITAQPGSLIAPSYFAFDLGLDKVLDDGRLGFYSGIQPEYIVAEHWYENLWTDVYPTGEAEATHYIRNLVAIRFFTIYQRGSFRVYQRRHEPGAICD